jgi:uncharacterized membrane protein HdeD (DUF308 family)
MPVVLVRHWWMLALRAAAAICFGLLSATDRLGSVAALVTLFTLLGAIDVGCQLVLARASRRTREAWQWPLIEAAPSALIVLALVLGPPLGVVALSRLLVTWALGQAGVGLAAALLGRTVPGDRLRIAEALWMLAFAVWVMLDPGPGNLAALTWLGTFVSGAGVLQAFRTFGLRSTSIGRAPVGAWRWPSWMLPPQVMRLLRPRSRATSWPLARPRQTSRPR